MEQLMVPGVSALHSSKSCAWYTPMHLLVRAKIVLQRIELDPASDYLGNLRVGADRFITEEENGLEVPWDGPVTVFCNPPSGKYRKKPMWRQFWQRLHLERAQGQLRHAVFVAFSLEQLVGSQRVEPSMLEFTTCVPSKRLRYVDAAGNQGESPTHGSAIVYVPGTVDRTKAFVHAFRDVGAIVRRHT